MQKPRTWQRILPATTIAVVVAGGALFAAPATLAETAAHPACTSVKVTTTNKKAVKAAIARISSCLADLQKSAGDAARAAQVANEAYLKAHGAATAAAKQSAQAQTASVSAAAKSKVSNARAAVLAAQLARTGAADDAANLILDGGGAGKTLYRLSRMDQLTSESKQVWDQAKHDQLAATQAATAAAGAAQQAQAESEAAKAAFDSAKQQSDAVAAVVAAQTAKQNALQEQLYVLEGGSASSGVALTSLPADATKAERAVAFARAQIGDPYVFAGAGPNSWDCSGLTMMAYASVGLSIGGHGATAQYNWARSHGKLVSYGDAVPGDLIFYTDGGGDMYHVAIYVGGGQMIEAPYEGLDVRQTSVRSYDRLAYVARPTA